MGHTNLEFLFEELLRFLEFCSGTFNRSGSLHDLPERLIPTSSELLYHS